MAVNMYVLLDYKKKMIVVTGVYYGVCFSWINCWNRIEYIEALDMISLQLQFTPMWLSIRIDISPLGKIVLFGCH